MSALDTFEWYLSTQAPGRSPEDERFIRRQREYLFALRSEDERQRFVEWAIGEIRRRAAAGHDGRARRKTP